MLPRLILGTAQLCESYGLAGSSVDGSGTNTIDFLRFAFEHGIVTFDTAPIYGDSEVQLGNLVGSADIHTKFHPAQNEVDSLVASLNRLRRDRLSLVYFHTPDLAKTNPYRISRVRKEVGSLADALGASEYTLAGFHAAEEHPMIDIIQFPINLLNLTVVRKMSENGTRNTRVFARSVLGQGLLAGTLPTMPKELELKYGSVIERYARTCSELGRSMSEVALVWVRDLPWIDSVIIGPSSLVELSQLQTAWASDPLTVDERSEVESQFESIATPYDPRFWGINP